MPLVLQRGVFTFDLFTITVSAPPISPMRTTFPAHPSLIFGSNIYLLLIRTHSAEIVEKLASLLM